MYDPLHLIGFAVVGNESVCIDKLMLTNCLMLVGTVVVYWFSMCCVMVHYVTYRCRNYTFEPLDPFLSACFYYSFSSSHIIHTQTSPVCELLRRGQRICLRKSLYTRSIRLSSLSFSCFMCVGGVGE